MRYPCLILVTLSLSVATACNGSPTQPQSPQSDPRKLLLPPIQGIVREVNGGPIAKARVLLDGSNLLTHPTLETNQNGEFELRSSDGICRTAGFGHLFVSSSGYFARRLGGPACTEITNPPPWIIEIKLQKTWTVAEDSTIQAVLSNDDLDWGDPYPPYYEYPCGPCVLITLASDMTAQSEVTIEWSSNDRLSAWFEASDQDYDTVKLGEYGAAPGESRISMVTPKGWRDYFYHVIKIGLPAGGRNAGGLQNAITVNVKLRKVE